MGIGPAVPAGCSLIVLLSTHKDLRDEPGYSSQGVQVFAELKSLKQDGPEFLVLGSLGSLQGQS